MILNYNVGDIIEIKSLDDLSNDINFVGTAYGFENINTGLDIPRNMFDCLGRTVTIEAVYNDDTFKVLECGWVFCKDLIKSSKNKFKCKKIKVSLDEVYNGLTQKVGG